jgi:hypothetical protein
MPLCGRGIRVVVIAAGLDRAFVAMILEQPREPALHDFAHHAEIVARGDVGRFDVEFAILVFHKPFRPRHNHAADSVCAHDVGVVVNLDAPWRMRQAEGFRKALQQPCLACGFRQVPAMRFACVGQHLFDQFALLAALRCADRDLAVHSHAQCLGQQRPVLELVRHKDHARRGLVVVELADEGAENLAWGQRRVGLGEVGAVAPVLPGAEEEHLDTGHAGVVMNREHVSFFNGTAD